MNRFVKSGSKGLLFITVFFIAMLFIDQANLLDIFVGNSNNIDIQHPEEVESSLAESTPFLDQISFEKVVLAGQSHVKQATNASSISKKVIVDEDSPSTASINASADVISSSFIDEHKDCYSFITIHYNIYIQNRTLLI